MRKEQVIAYELFYKVVLPNILLEKFHQLTEGSGLADFLFCHRRWKQFLGNTVAPACEKCSSLRTEGTASALHSFYTRWASQWQISTAVVLAEAGTSTG